MAKRSLTQRLKEFLARPPETESVVMPETTSTEPVAATPSAPIADTTEAPDQREPKRDLITETLDLIKEAHGDIISYVHLTKVLREQLDRQKSDGSLTRVGLEGVGGTGEAFKITGQGDETHSYVFTDGGIRLETTMSVLGWGADLSYNGTKLLQDEFTARHGKGSAIKIGSGINPSYEVRARVLDKVLKPLCEKLSSQVNVLRTTTEKNFGLLAKADLNWATQRLDDSVYGEGAKADHVDLASATLVNLAKKLDDILAIVKEMPEQERPLEKRIEGSPIFPIRSMTESFHITVPDTEISISLAGGEYWRASRKGGSAEIMFSGHKIMEIRADKEYYSAKNGTGPNYVTRSDMMAQPEFIQQVMNRVLAPAIKSLEVQRGMLLSKHEAAIEAAAEEISGPSIGGM